MSITIRVTGLYRDDRIICPVLLVEADLMHINMYSFLHISIMDANLAWKSGRPRLSQLEDSIKPYNVRALFLNFVFCFLDNIRVAKF